MKLLLLGSEGSMGKRYQACLNYLKYPFTTFDVKTNNIKPNFKDFTHIMICTPTYTHYEYLKELIPIDKQILCEKPISKNLDELNSIKLMLSKHKSKFTMMMQYAMIVNPSIRAGSHYNYYKTGNDGLYWDCLQILHLSNELPIVENTSPIWKCMINGKVLSLARMDEAYVAFLQSWLNDNIVQDLDKIITTHVLAKRLQGNYDSRNSQSCNSDTGQK